MASYTTTSFQQDTTTNIIELDVAPHLKQRYAKPSFEEDPEHDFKSQLSTYIDILNLIQAPISAIQYRLVNHNRSIDLSPVVLNKDVHQSGLYHYKINLPDAILPNCFVVNQFNVNADDHSIIIDALTKTGLLITCILKVSDFIIPSVTSSVNYQDWCRISNPYGFDVRRPHILHSVNYNYIMVLLKDGGLIGLHRSLETDLFKSIEPIVYNDNSYLQNIKSLLKPWNKIKINGDPELSFNTVVDVLNFENYLITITINKKLRVWSMSSKCLIFEKDLVELLNLENDTGAQFLESSPTKLLDLLKISENRSYLTVYFPLKEGAFKVFKIEHSYHEGDFQLIDLGLTLSTAFPEISTIWVIGDFKTIKLASELSLWVLWKSGTSSIVKKLAINDNFSTEWSDINSNLLQQSNIFNDYKSSNNESWTEFYQHKIFQSGIYSNLVLETSLKIFEINFESSQEQQSQTSSLLNNISRAVSASLDSSDINYELSLVKQWKKFDSLCQEFKKQSDEPLRFFYLNDSAFLANRGSLTLIRNETRLESLSHEMFLSSLSKFIKKLPVEVLTNVNDCIADLISNDSVNESSINTEFSRIFNSRINNKFNPEFLYLLVEELSSAGDLFQVIENILELQEHSNEYVVSAKLSTFSESVLMNSIKDIVEFNSNQLFKIIILLLVLEFDNKDKLHLIISKILTLYKNYEISKKTISISFNNNGSVEIDRATDISRSILSRLIHKQSKGFIFSNVNLLTFINSSVLKLINSMEFQQLAMIELLNTQNYNIIHTQFWPLLNVEDPIVLLFKAYTLIKLGLANKASKILTNSSLFISSYKITSHDIENLASLSIGFDVTSFFQTPLSKYYFHASDLFRSERQFIESLNFINLSIANESIEDSDNESHEARFYAQFQISLEILNFQLIETSLKQIHTKALKEKAISDFIDKLQETNDLKRLTELKLFDEYYVIDNILHTRATNTDDCIRALYFHKVLYAFRLTFKNQREAIESLYEYIVTRQSDTQTKMELYLTILNLLRTLDTTDQWILFKLENNEYKEKFLNELNDELTALMMNN